MTILLYNHFELEERTHKRTSSCWKAWHLTLYISAAIFGVVNYVFLQNTMKLVDNNCVLFPRDLVFREIELINNITSYVQNSNATNYAIFDDSTTENAQANITVTEAPDMDKENVTKSTNIVKRDIPNKNESIEAQPSSDTNTTRTGISTRRTVLYTERTLFGKDKDCVFAEYMPVLSTIFALTWIVMFTICPAGGRARTGLQQPWRILMPALVFSLVMAGLTGHSFSMTNKGLHAFCEAFFEVTNSTTCSSVNEHIERSWNASWSFSGRASFTRASSAAVWASWACATALLIARCLAAPDFQVKKTSVYLKRDPLNQVTPYLKRGSKNSRSSASSPNKRDTMSVRSEPTATTELVTVSVEQGQESIPASLMATPHKAPQNEDLIEMTYNPQERNEKGNFN